MDERPVVSVDLNAEHPEEAAYAGFSNSGLPNAQTLKLQTDQITSYSEFSQPSLEPASPGIAPKSSELSAYVNFHHSTPTTAPPSRHLGPPIDAPDAPCLVRAYRLMSGTMPEAARKIEEWPVLCFFDSCLRGLSQVIFLNNPVFGLCVLVAAGKCDWYLLVYGVVGVLSSTAAAIALGVESGPVRGGLMGYNGYLTGVAIALFQYGDQQHWQGLVTIQVFFASVCSTLFQIALGRFMVPLLGIPPFTLPFHFASWVWLLAAESSIYCPNADSTLLPLLTRPTAWADRDRVVMETGDVLQGMLQSVGQVFLLEDTWSGVVLLIGAAVASPITASMTLLGAVVGTLAAIGLGVPPTLVYRGLCGYNSGVVAAGLGGMFLILSWRTVGITVFASVFASVLTFTVSNALAPTGMPALTFPAAATLVLFLLVTQSVKRPVGVPLAVMTVPEDHLARMALTRLARSSFPEINGLCLATLGSVEEMAEVERVLVPTLLCHAAANGDFDRVKEMLELGAEATVCDYDGRTPLHLACARGHKSLMRLLLQNTADLHATDRWGGTALWDAYRAGHEWLCQLLVEQGCTTGKSTIGIGQELCSLAARGMAKQIAILTQCGCNASTCDFGSRTALHLAASNGQVEVLSLLLRSDRIEVNAVDQYFHTPLDDSVRHGHKRGAQLLRVAGGFKSTSKSHAAERIKTAFERNAPANRTMLADGFTIWKGQWAGRKDSAQLESNTADSLARAVGTTERSQRRRSIPAAAAVDECTEHATRVLLLCTAAKEGRTELIKQVLSTAPRHGQAGEQKLVDKGDYDHRTPIHVAAAEGNQSCVECLLDADADPNPKDRWGHTPLFDACSNQHLSCVRTLTRFGAELKMDEIELASQLCLEARLNRQAVVYTWLVAGCNPNAADYDGRTALHAACACGSLSTALNLLEFSADPNATNRWGNTPSSEAALFGHSRLVELLQAWIEPETHSPRTPTSSPGYSPQSVHPRFRITTSPPHSPTSLRSGLRISTSPPHSEQSASPGPRITGSPLHSPRIASSSPAMAFGPVPHSRSRQTAHSSYISNDQY